jgi:hypothetical protein
MSLVQAAGAIASQFEYTDADITRCVAEFIREMSKYVHFLGQPAGNLTSPCLLGLGLQERRPSMCQIPTYVSRVARGTETVSSTRVGKLDND